ncbi:MAG: succinate dehydrogenase assembly factor 2 [Rickettsiales bacterium]
MDRETRIKRLRYRSWHRGWKETDLILGGFADEHLADMGDNEIDIYEKLLDENDADIWDWLIEKMPPTDNSYRPILERLREHGHKTH